VTTVSLGIVFLCGVIVWGGFNWAVEITNTEAFCISCHEMEVNVYREYQDTIHYTNRTGVRATCPDCHVPRDWPHKMQRKITSTYELFQHFRGTLDTREKFLDRRPYLVSKVWNMMKESNSRECRNCHSFAYMNNQEQHDVAGPIHLEASDAGMTCIDCHMGIAHELPVELMDREHERFKHAGIECYMCHTDMVKVRQDEDWEWE
jgi:cytochrome c-type protein NapC